MNNPTIVLAGLTSFAFPPQADAHHGFTAHFDPDRIIRIEGVVKQFDFINPHGFLFVSSVDDDGEPVVYVCELPVEAS